MEMTHRFSPGTTIHFIGMGGVGMSALAQILAKRGCIISGCDLKENDFTQSLEKQGILSLKGHDPEHLSGKELVVYSSGIPFSNGELAETRRRGILLAKRGELLSWLMEEKFGIAVSGAHGKTTTTALIGLALMECGLKPTVLVGGWVSHFGGNVQFGEGNFWVTEADESDGSFLYLKPKIGIVTNIDKEHMDFYQDEKQLLTAYSEFVQQTSLQGTVIACGDDTHIEKILNQTKRGAVSYGIGESVQIRARNIRLSPLGSQFDLYRDGSFIHEVALRIPGVHNVLNALAALAVGMELKLSVPQLARGMSHFQGVHRRFQIKSQAGDIWIVDDYAHHPTEIDAVIKVAKNLGRARIIGIFQPHRYTRTQVLLNEFSEVLQGVDRLIVTDIYSADEAPIPNVSGRQLFDKVVEYGHRSCEFLPKHRIKERILELAQPGDTVLFLGAGDITEVADQVAQEVQWKPL